MGDKRFGILIGGVGWGKHKHSVQNMVLFFVYLSYDYSSDFFFQVNYSVVVKKTNSGVKLL